MPVPFFLPETDSARQHTRRHRPVNHRHLLCRYQHLPFADNQTFCRQPPDCCAECCIWGVFGPQREEDRLKTSRSNSIKKHTAGHPRWIRQRAGHIRFPESNNAMNYLPHPAQNHAPQPDLISAIRISHQLR